MDTIYRSKVSKNEMNNNVPKTKHRIQQILESLKLCEEHSIHEFYPKVRDRDDVAVFQCEKSGVLFLSRCDHIGESYYEKQEAFNYWWNSKNREEAKALKQYDDVRRVRQCKAYLQGKRWLDFGTGVGGVLDLARGIAREIYAVEPQQDSLKVLQELGYKAYPSLESFPEKDFDVITLFHVLEHLTEPLQALAEIYRSLRPGGNIIVEVPHANDFLLKTIGLEKFKAFTFWSEHLMLHTRESMHTFLEVSQFKNIRIYGYQRFPFANHVYWLLRGKPGGHEKLGFLNNALCNNPYEYFLKASNRTDTLIATAEK